MAAVRDRDVFCRETTKLHKKYARTPLSALLASLTARDTVKNKIILVIAKTPAATPTAGRDPIPLYRELAAENRTHRETVKETARRLGLGSPRLPWSRRPKRTASDWGQILN
jgi:16S rRNA C1402 (ribose-2'-O) methylase RsmI